MKKKEKTKEKVKQASLEMFRSKGYAHATVQEIMSLANLGYGTFYQYYKSKKEVLMEEGMQILDAITKHYIHPPATEKSLYKRTYNSILNIFESCHEHRKVLDIMKSAKTTDEDIQEIWDGIMEELFRRLERDITWSIKHGICRDVDLTIALISLDGMVKGTIDYIIANEFNNEEVERIAQNVSLLFKEAIFLQDEMPRQAFP
jgi:AcrR family transcriptional regulator